MASGICHALETCDHAGVKETTSNNLVCSQCECEWADPQERWAAFLDVNDEVALFCPACVAAEFDNNA